MRRRFWRGVCLALSTGLGILRAEPGPELIPRYYMSESSWMDRSHRWAGSNLHGPVKWFDSLFGRAEDAGAPAARSTFRAGMYMITDPRHPGTDIQTDLNFSGHVHLPRMREKVRLVLDNNELEALPGTHPDEQDDTFNLALRRVGDLMDVDVGAKLKAAPVGFVKVSTGAAWRMAGLRWHLGQKFFYQNDTGYGEVSTLSQFGWLGPRLLLGHTSAGRWTEESDGLEWEDALSLSHVRMLMNEKDRNQFVGQRKIARGCGVRLSMNGHHDGSGTNDRYRAATFWRSPLGRKDWCYLEVAPEVEWTNDRDWNAEYILRVGVDIWFRSGN